MRHNRAKLLLKEHFHLSFIHKNAADCCIFVYTYIIMLWKHAVSWKGMYIQMSHWGHMMVDGAKFWISCQPLAFLSSFSRWQLIQKPVPSTIMWRQCDNRIEKRMFLQKIFHSPVWPKQQGGQTELTNFYLQHAVRLILWSVCQKALAIEVQILTYFSTYKRK